MKRLGILAFLFLLIGITIVCVLISRKEKHKEPSEDIEHVAVKRCLFKTADSLSEWDEKVLTKYRTDYNLAEYEGTRCVKAGSNNSASALYMRQRLSQAERPFVSWEWIVEKFPEHRKEENLSDKKEFDFGAQVYVIFESRFFLMTKAIQYVWAENLPVGTVSDSPYTKNVKIMVLESGHSKEWKHEIRDVKEDFRALFGENLKKDVEAFAFMTDSDSTGSSAAAYYSNITLGYVKPAKEEAVGGKRPKAFQWLRGIFSMDNNERRNHQEH